MKKIKFFIIFAIILGIIVSIYAANQTKKDYTIEEIKESKYHIIYKDEKMGVIDEKGNVVVNPIYEYIQLPNPSKPIFICINGENSKVLNEKQEEILKEYNQVSAIPLQLELNEIEYEKSVLRYEKDGKYGLLDLNGDIVLKATYDEITGLKYKEGELLVKKDNKFGVINIKGAKIIDAKYDMIEGDRFFKDESYKEEGYITCVRTEEGYKYGYINSKGKEILKTEYNEITRIIENPKFTDIYLIARKDGQMGLIKNKKAIIDFSFQNIEYDIASELLLMEKNGKYGIYNMEGKEILSAQYDEILLKGIYIYANKDENESYYDMQGNAIGNMQYLSVNKTNNENYYITINKDGLCGVIDKNNKVKIKNEYTYLEYLFDNYFIAAKQDSKFGIINDKEEVQIEFQYDVLSKIEESNIVQAKKIEENQLDIYDNKLKKSYSEKNAKVYINKNYIQIIGENGVRYFDLEGKEVKNSDIYINNELLAIKENGKWGFANKQGKVQVECIYDEVTEFNEYGFAGIKKDGKWGVIDTNKNIIQEPIYEIESNYTKPDFIGKYFKQYYDTGEVYYTNQVEKEMGNESV